MQQPSTSEAAAAYVGSNGATYQIIYAQCAPSLYAKRIKCGLYREDAAGLEKRCSRCREYWPADSEFFPTSNRSDGLHDWCKACHSEYRTTKKH